MKLCLLAIGFILLLSIDKGESDLVIRAGCGSGGCYFEVSITKKRSTEEGADSGSFWFLLPCKFSTWDTNKDDSITLAEFAFAGHTDAKGSNTGNVFKMIDKDGNRNISREEFDAAPLLLEKC